MNKEEGEARRREERARLRAEMEKHVNSVLEKIEKVYQSLEFKHILLRNNCLNQILYLRDFADLSFFDDSYELLRECTVIKKLERLREEMIDSLNKLKSQHQASMVIYFSQRDLYFGPNGCNFLKNYEPDAKKQIKILENSIKATELSLKTINDMLCKEPLARGDESMKDEKNAKPYHDYLGSKYNQLRTTYTLLISEYAQLEKSTHQLLVHQGPFTIEHLQRERETLYNRLEKLFKELKDQYIESHDLYFGLSAIELFKETIPFHSLPSHISDYLLLHPNFETCKSYPLYDEHIERIIAKFGAVDQLKIPIIIDQLKILEEAIRATEECLYKLRSLMPPMRTFREILEAEIGEEKKQILGIKRT
jgi:hypothetical protein